eukprot:gb/GECG01006133.1/.p1 GENE.gb/GECG01006133.1/~~gb/GECG01006133.1/.p1  ORF type:complete len:367 (+),score=44.02 gb/GECG01006133.1/:1-1101(+)
MLFYYVTSERTSASSSSHHEGKTDGHSEVETQCRVLQSSQTTGGQRESKKALTEILSSPYYREKAKEFHDSPIVAVNSPGVFESVCCLQKEFAVLPRLEHVGVGSSKATTCVILLAHNPTAGYKAAAHVDSTDCKAETIASILSETSQGLASEACLELGIVGAYDGNYVSDTLFESSSITTEELERCEEQSLEIVLHILNALRDCNIRCVLSLAAVLSLNTKHNEQGTTIPYDLDAAVDSRGHFFKPEFIDSGPASAVRNLRFLSNWSDLQRIARFDSASRAVIYEVTRFPLDSLPEGFLILYKSDPEGVLMQMSTSPDAEPPSFVADLKRSINVFLENNMDTDSMFANKGRLRYMWKDHQWVQID